MFNTFYQTHFRRNFRQIISDKAVGESLQCKRTEKSFNCLVKNPFSYQTFKLNFLSINESKHKIFAIQKYFRIEQLLARIFHFEQKIPSTPCKKCHSLCISDSADEFSAAKIDFPRFRKISFIIRNKKNPSKQSVKRNKSLDKQQNCATESVAKRKPKR